MKDLTKQALYEEYKCQLEKRNIKFSFDDFIEYYEMWKQSSFDSFDRYMDYVEKNLLNHN